MASLDPRLSRVLESPARALIRGRFRATASAWPVLRRLPADSTLFGPPRRFAESLPAWARERGNVEMRMVDDADHWELPLPLAPSSDPPSWFHVVLSRDDFPTWVASVPGGRVVGTDSTIVGPDDTVFADLYNAWPNSVGHHKVLLRARLPKLQNVRGTVAVVGAAMSDNYTHWMVDVVPRLRLLGDDLRRADHVVVPSRHRFQRDCLEAAGVPMDRLIEPDRAMHIAAEELLVPSLVPRASEPAIAYLRDLFAEHRSTAPPHRRLYVTRANVWRRRVANDEELARALAARGFETVVMDDLSVGEQARLFSEAEAVVGPNGSALINVVFCQPGTVFVELFDSNYVISGDWEVAARVGARYHLFISPSPPSASQWRDIQAPVGDVLRALDTYGLI